MLPASEVVAQSAQEGEAAHAAALMGLHVDMRQRQSPNEIIAMRVRHGSCEWIGGLGVGVWTCMVGGCGRAQSIVSLMRPFLRSLILRGGFNQVCVFYTLLHCQFIGS